jgi:hypothetical protein
MGEVLLDDARIRDKGNNPHCAVEDPLEAMRLVHRRTTQPYLRYWRAPKS